MAFVPFLGLFVLPLLGRVGGREREEERKPPARWFLPHMLAVDGAGVCQGWEDRAGMAASQLLQSALAAASQRLCSHEAEVADRINL